MNNKNALTAHTGKSFYHAGGGCTVSPGLYGVVQGTLYGTVGVGSWGGLVFARLDASVTVQLTRERFGWHRCSTLQIPALFKE